VLSPEIEDREEVVLLGAYLPKNLLLPIGGDHLRQDPRLGSEVAVDRHFETENFQ
jgi:hypothetical protein